MELEFRTKNTYYGNAHYLRIDTDTKEFSTVSRCWVAKEVPVISKHDIDHIKQLAIKNGYTEVH